MALTQGGPEREVVPVKRIRQHDPARHIPSHGLVDQLERQVGLRLINHLRGDVRFRPASRILAPLLGQIQPPTHRVAQLGLPPMQTHCHLAVGDLPQRAAVLSRGTDRMFARLRKRRLVDHPAHRLMTVLTQPLRQPLLNLRHGPRTLVQKLVQRLLVGAREPRRHGLHRFTVSIQEQALHVNPGPVPPLAASDRLDQIFQKLAQPPLHPRQLFWRHAGSLSPRLEKDKLLLN